MTGFLFENKSHTRTQPDTFSIDTEDALSYTSTGYNTHKHYTVVFQLVLFDDSTTFLSFHNKHATRLAHVHTYWIDGYLFLSIFLLCAYDFRSDTWHDRWYIADEDVKKRFRCLRFFRICFSSSVYFSFKIFFFAYLNKVHYFFSSQIQISTCTDVEITQSLLTTIVWSSESSFCSKWAH